MRYGRLTRHAPGPGRRVAPPRPAEPRLRDGGSRPQASEGFRGVAPPEQHWQDVGFAVAASAVLAAYNNVTGLNSGHERWYVRLNAAATGAALAAAALSGLTLADLGLGRGRWLPGRLGCGLAAGAGAAWLVIAAVPATRPVLGDQRATGLDGRDIAYQALVRIPVGTALWEETAFRGVLQAALRRVMSDTAAIAVTSGVFGVWHIRPTLQALRANGLAGDRRRALAGTCAGVAATAAGGALLSWLRARSGRLADPVLLHSAVNSGGLIAAHAVAVLGQKGKPPGPSD